MHDIVKKLNKRNWGTVESKTYRHLCNSKQQEGWS